MRLSWIVPMVGFFACAAPAITYGLTRTTTEASAPSLSTAEQARVDAAMNHLVQSGVPGIELAVVKDGTLVYARGYGVKDLRTKRPVTAATPMELGSLTLPFTAAAILQLKEAGKISLDEKLGKYVPEYILGRDITLGQLLKLESGAADYFWQDEVSARIFVEQPSFDRVLNLFEDHKLEFPPGTQWAFNNTNYFLLGKVIERVTGMSWEAYVKRNIFARAGMTHTTTMAHEQELSDFPNSYWFMNNKISPAPRTRNGWGVASFNAVSTVQDLAKWNAALQAGKIINRDDVALMMNPGPLDNGKPTPLASGITFNNNPLEGHKRIWASAGSLGFTSDNAILPDDRLELIVIANANITIIYPEPLLDAAFFALFPEAAAQRYGVVAGEDPAITAKIKDALLAIRAGSMGADQTSDEFRAGLDDVKPLLLQLGDIDGLYFKGQKASDQGTSYDYRVQFGRGDFLFSFTLDQTGKFIELQVSE